MKIKKGKNEGIYFVFNDVFIVYGLIVFCIFYGFCFGVFDFFFLKMERRNYFIIEIKVCRFYMLLYFIFFWKVIFKFLIVINLFLKRKIKKSIGI